MKTKDFFAFRYMLIPVIVQIIFWLGTVICFAVGIFGLFTHAVLTSIILILFGPLLLRLVCEYVIVQFKINDSLREIRDAIVSKNTFK